MRLYHAFMVLLNMLTNIYRLEEELTIRRIRLVAIDSNKFLVSLINWHKKMIVRRT